MLNGADLPFNPRTCSSEGASQCIYNACFGEPVSVPQDHLQAGFVKQACTSLKEAFSFQDEGNYCLPCSTGRVANTSKAEKGSTFGQIGNVGDEQHPIVPRIAESWRQIIWSVWRLCCYTTSNNVAP